MSNFADTMESKQQKANGHDRLTPQISWTQKDVDLVQHVFQHVDDMLKNNLLPAIGKFVKAQVELLKERVAELEARVNELEMTGVKFVGTYQRAADYKRGDVCNYDGAMWVATCAVPPREVPGKSVAWQLTVKRGECTPRLPTKGGARVSSIVEKRPT